MLAGLYSLLYPCRGTGALLYFALFLIHRVHVVRITLLHVMSNSKWLLRENNGSGKIRVGYLSIYLSIGLEYLVPVFRFGNFPVTLLSYTCPSLAVAQCKGICMQSPSLSASIAVQKNIKVFTKNKKIKLITYIDLGGCSSSCR